jgi:hypothetical protein
MSIQLRYDERTNALLKQVDDAKVCYINLYKKTHGHLDNNFHRDDSSIITLANLRQKILNQALYLLRYLYPMMVSKKVLSCYHERMDILQIG